MNKKYNTLNEEINRIKSLFTEERLYGNIVDQELIIEQGLGKILLNALSAAGTALKGFDPKLLTSFLETPMKTYDDIVKHLDEYSDIWGQIIKNDVKLDQSKEIFEIFSSIKAGTHSKWKSFDEVPEEVFTNLMTGVTRKGGLRDHFLDLWEYGKGRQTKYTPENAERLVVKTGDETVIHVKKQGTNEIETFKINDDGGLEKMDYDLEKAADDFIDSKKGIKGKGDLNSGGTTKTTEPTNPVKEPTKTNEEILKTIDLSIDGATGKPKKKVTLKQLMEHKKKNEGSIIYKNPENGKLEVITNMEEWEIHYEELDSGEIQITGLTKKSKETIDTTKGSDIGADGPKKSWWKGWIKPKGTQGENFTPLRYFFPQSSWLLHKINFIPSKIRITNKGPWSRPRWSVAPGKWNEWTFPGGAKTSVRSVENTLRIGVENLFYGYVYGVAMDYIRTDDVGDMSGNPIKYWQDWFSSDIVKYQPILSIYTVTTEIINSVDFWESLDQNCINKCENQGISPTEVLSSSCYLDCKAEVDELKVSFENAGETLETYSNLLKEIGELGNMSDEQKRKFCSEGEDGKRYKMILELENLKQTQIKLKEKVNEVVGSATIVDKGYKIIRNKLESWGWLDSDNEITDTLIETESGEKITEGGINKLIKNINDICVSIMNPEEHGDDVPSDPDIPDEEKNTDEEENEDGKEENSNIVFNVVVTPIELVG